MTRTLTPAGRRTISKPFRRLTIREDWSNPKPLRVDRDQAVIYGVKLVGLVSLNGRKYLPEALRKGASLYEGAPVNINHSSEDESVPSSYDRFGQVHNPHYVEGQGIFGDIHYLKSHPMAERLTEAAEKMPDIFNMSHVIEAGTTRDGDLIIVHEILEVRSIDVVTDGATTKSLTESRMKLPPAKLRKILKEMGYKEDDAGAGAPVVMPEDDAEPDHVDHLGAAILSIMQQVKDGSMDPAEGQKKILAAYKIAQDSPEKEDDEEEDEEPDKDKDDKKVAEDDSGNGGWEEDEDPEKKKDEPAKESRRPFKRSKDPAVVQLQEELATLKRERDQLKKKDLILQECRAAKIEPTATQLKALSLLEGSDRKNLIAELKGAGAARVRSISPGLGNGHDMDAKAFSRAVRNGR